MYHSIRRLALGPLLSIGMASVPVAAAAQTAPLLDATEFQRRLAICMRSEAWLRTPCLETLVQQRPAPPEAAAPAPASPTATDDAAPDGPREMHMVGIYEPRPRRGEDGATLGGETQVQLDRPGKSVTLVLASFEPTRWTIVRSPGTDIERVLLGGRGAVPSRTTLDGKDLEADRIALPLAYQPRGNRFQPFHTAAALHAGTKRADSFHGSYQAPESGFVIDAAPGIELPEEAAAKLFQAALDRENLPPRLRAAYPDDAAIDEPRTGWHFTKDGMVRVTDDGTRIDHPVSLDVPRISWPVGAAFDASRQRAWGISLGGEGYLYRYELETGDWTAWSMMNYDAGGLIYDDASGRLITTPGRHGRREFRILSDDGRTIHSIRIDAAAFPGLIDLFDPGNGPAPGMRPLAIDGRDLLVTTAAWPRNLRASVAQQLVYLVNLNTGAVSLVK